MSKALPDTWAVPGAMRARFGARAGAQRAMISDGHLLVILHDIPVAGEHTRTASLFWRTPDGAWKSSGNAGKSGLKSLRDHLESFRKVVDDLEEQGEAARSAAEYFSVLQASAPVLRSARNMHRALQQAREGVTDPEVITLRDQAADIERALDLIHSDATLGLDFTTAKRAEEQVAHAEEIARSGHRLNLLAALFFPLTAITGMFGMQLVSGLEHSGEPWLFWAVVVAAIMLGFFARGRITVPAAKG